MATVNRFEDLQVWQKARLLSKAIDSLVKTGGFATDFDLKRQVQRSAGSVMDNIAEGFGRGGRGELVQFLSIAKGSLTETKSQLYRALDKAYLEEIDFQTIYNKADEVGKMIEGLITYLNQSQIKGIKYKKEETENRKL